MKISKAEEQSLRLLTCLARAGDQLTLTELAEREHLPEPTVAKLLARLRRGDVVRALRGRNGGYALSRPAARTTVADVIRALGGTILVGAGCSPARPLDASCPHVDDCGMRPMWRLLERRLEQVFENTSMADLCRPEFQVTRQLTELWPEERGETAAALDRTGTTAERS